MNKIIFNSEHVDIFKNLIKKSDEIIIISPYLSFFKNFDITNYNVNLRLYTKLTDNKKDAINAERYLVIEKLIKSYNKSNNEFLLFNITNLYSKIYIFKKNNNIHHAIVTSANYTSAGLEGTNEECGIVLDNISDLHYLINRLNLYLSCPVDKNNLLFQIKKFKNDIKKCTKTKHSIDKNFNIKVKYDSTSLLNNISSNIPTIWLKPLGTSDEIKNMTSEQIINFIAQRQKDKRCLFRNNPENVKVGDILICYIVKIRKVICIRRVSSSPAKASSNPQWPWSVNIAKIDGILDIKLKDNYQIDDLLSDFLMKYPNGYVDHYNNKDFRQIRRSDKLKLTEKFGKSAIESYLQH